MPRRMHLTTSVWLVAALVAALAVIVPPTAAEARTDATAESRFVDSINAVRAQRGLPRLHVASDLRSVARTHSARMASRNHLHHNPNLSSDVRNWTRLTENVGRGPSVSSIHGALMASSGHRANILDANVTQVGVGVEVRGSTVWVTQVFRRPTRTSSFIFSDVRTTSTHGRDIGRLARSGVTAGCGGSRFCPKRDVTRAEMATFLGRAKALVPRNPTTYSDASRAPLHAANIEAIHNARLTKGCGGGRFCPTRDVTRAEMATFLARSLGLDTSRTRTRYTDVANGSTHAGAIEALARAGITKGCARDRYCPNRPVTREEMASFLVRGFGL